MRSETLFISDLHLSAVRPETVHRFRRFLEKRAAGAAALYILGDLFDAYIGDDESRFPNAEVRQALRQTAASGTRIFFQHGNRDFLLGSRFCRESGLTLLDEYAVIELHGTPTLLTHGDLLCTDDEQYQRARERVRAASWKRNALAKPLFVRRLYARWYRFRSGRDKQQKTAEIMDVNPSTVVETMRRFDVLRLIHGHTHRPAVHEVPLGEHVGQRFVLAEWGGHGAVLVWQEGRYGIEAVE